MGVADAVNGSDNVFHQFVYILGAAVGQLPLGHRPDALVWIQLRRIGRKVLDAQAAMFFEDLFDGRSFVGRGVVEQKDDRASEAAQQFPEEHTDLGLSDVVVEEQVVKSQAMPPGTDGNS